jgi:hypothetical protein
MKKKRMSLKIAERGDDLFGIAASIDQAGN